MASPPRTLDRLRRENPDAPGTLQRLRDEDLITPRSAVEQFAVDNADNDYLRGLASSSLGVEAGSYYREADFAEQQGNLRRAQELRSFAQEKEREAAITAPRVRSSGDVASVSDAIDFAQGGFGQLVPSVAATTGPGILGGIAGGIVGGPVGAAIGAGLAGGYSGFQLEAGEAASNQQGDEAIRGLPVDQRIREQNIKGAQAAAAELIFPTLVGGRLAKSVQRIFSKLDETVEQTAKAGARTKAVALESGAEAATEATQTLIGQASLNRLNPNRDRSHDVQELIDSTILGALGGGGISLGTTVPGYVLSKTPGLPAPSKVPKKGTEVPDEGTPLDTLQGVPPGRDIPDAGRPVEELQATEEAPAAAPQITDEGTPLEDFKRYSRPSDFLDDETRTKLEAIGQDVDIEQLADDAEGDSAGELDDYFNRNFEEVSTAAGLPEKIDKTNLGGFEVLTKLPSLDRFAKQQRAHFPIEDGPAFLQDQINKGIISDGEVKPLGDYLDSIGATTQQMLLEAVDQRRYTQSVLEEHQRKGKNEDRSALIARTEELLRGLPESAEALRTSVRQAERPAQAARQQLIESLNRFGVVFADRSNNNAATDYDLLQFENSLASVKRNEKEFAAARKRGLSKKGAERSAIAKAKQDLINREGVTFQRADGSTKTFLKKDIIAQTRRREGREAVSVEARDEDSRALNAGIASILARNDFTGVVDTAPSTNQREVEPLSTEDRKELLTRLTRLHRNKALMTDALTDDARTSEERAQAVEALEQQKAGWDRALRAARDIKQSAKNLDLTVEEAIEKFQPDVEVAKLLRSAPHMKATEQLVDDLGTVAQTVRDKQIEVLQESTELAEGAEGGASFVRTTQSVVDRKVRRGKKEIKDTGEVITDVPFGRNAPGDLAVEQDYSASNRRLGVRHAEEQTGAGAQIGLRNQRSKTINKVADFEMAARLKRLAGAKEEVSKAATTLMKTPIGDALVTASHAIALGSRPENKLSQQAQDLILSQSPERHRAMDNAARVVVTGNDVKDPRLAKALQAGATIVAPNASPNLRQALTDAGYRQRVLPGYTRSQLEKSVVGASWVPSAGSGKAYREAEGDYRLEVEDLVEVEVPRGTAPADTEAPQRGNLETVARYTRAEIRANPDKIYVFGDNVAQRGFGGQAKEARGEPNAVGVPTKYEPTMNANAFFGRDAAKEKAAIKAAVDRLVALQKQGKTIVLPRDGLGTGRAQLQQRAPEVARYLQDQLARLQTFTGETAQKQPEQASVPRGTTPEFDKLPSPKPGVRTMTYAGIGSRSTPGNMQRAMAKIAATLESRGYTLNTGDAAGADSAFAQGAKDKNIFTANDATEQTQAIAKEIHPAPYALRAFPLKLMARNTNQVFGKNLDTPVDFVLTWTPDGAETSQERSRETGGTGQAIDMASRKGIPVINMNKPGWQQRLLDAMGDQDKKFSRQDESLAPGDPRRGQEQGAPIFEPDEGLAQQVREYLARILSPDVVADIFTPLSLYDSRGNPVSGYFDLVTKAIHVSMDSLNPMSTAAHEAFHAFFHQLSRMDHNRELYDKLIKFTRAPHIRKQLRDLLQHSPAALDQLRDPEERLAYMFQFYETRNPDGTRVLKLTPENRNIFKELAHSFAKLLGFISRQDAALSIFEALRTGELRTIPGIQDKILSLQNKGLARAISTALGPVRRGITAAVLTPTDRLRATGVAEYIEIADLYHRDPKDPGDQALLGRRAQVFGQYRNRLFAILEHHGVNSMNAEARAKMAQATRNLQAMKDHPEGSLEADIRKLLNMLHLHKVRAGVKRLDPESGTWVTPGYVPNYFPRVWSRSALSADMDGFVRLLVQEAKAKGQNLTEDSALKTVSKILRTDGLVDPDGDPLFSPAEAAVNPRIFDFIDETNAHKFVEYQEQDLLTIMTRHIRSAVHRAEHSRTFDHDSSGIIDRLNKARATPEQRRMAERAIQAMDGRLEHDALTPLQRDVMNGAMTLVNFAILPMALFSSMVDPLGVMVRTGSVKAAFTTFKRGVQQLYDDTRKRKGTDQELAEMLGIIEEENMLEIVGDTYNGMYMNQSLRKANDLFFKVIGLNSWTRGTRIGALTASQLYLRDHATDKKVLSELGLKEGDIVDLGNGQIATRESEGLSGVQVARVHRALFRMVDEAILRPNAAQRPIWMSDPRFMLFGHLKQFTFSFHNTIIKQVHSNWQRAQDEGAPALKALSAFIPMLSYVPMMMAADMTRAMIGGRFDDDDRELEDIVADAIQRSAITGVGTFAFDMSDDYAYNGAPVNTLFGPVIDQGVRLTRAAVDPDVEFADAATKLLPGYAFWRGWLE